ncbi:GntR family transcriptional regulator [Bradyrhizobium sp. BR 10289]|uniref:GntR family transcriptional regulator n=1 Tax=Bradyrhizobium sp. BR 10289 TaxID=2749993 RepID=UPI001C653BBD|nr:GntR family transcriptional regulator [Bradyrhizobium sp. BR 10289]MBW7970245.1 GntR family transcriptional regulator [Bradyrhizobium sp. BR 10289]
MSPAAGIPEFSPAKGTLLHRQLFLVLREQILRGAFGPSGALPKEEELCKHFRVSRITVRRALADLATLGLVERRHGLGTFVRQGTAIPRAAPNLSLIDELKKQASETEVQVLLFEHALPTESVVHLLQLGEGEEAIHAVRLRTLDGMPVMLTDAWIPSEFRKGVSASRLRKSPLYELLLGQGVVFGRVLQEFTAVIADPTLAGQMKVEVGAALLRLVRVMHDDKDRPILYLAAFLSSERSRILMDIPGDTVNTLTAGRIVHDGL